jgi:prepilin peptidase CpaA
MMTALVLTGASILAACSDLAARRIPNALTFGLAVLAVGLSALHGLWSAAVSVLLFLVVFLAGSVPYGRGWIGGGDVKLLAAGAAIANWPGAITFLLATAIAGGILSTVELARQGRLRLTVNRLAVATAAGDLASGMDSDHARRKLPYALAITAGALVLLASETFAPWLQLVRV